MVAVVIVGPVEVISAAVSVEAFFQMEVLQALIQLCESVLLRVAAAGLICSEEC